MNVNTMRRLDAWLGVPLCFLLTCWRRVSGLWRRRDGRSPQVRRILFVKLAEQGATVLAHGAISRAVERVGRENVFFLVFQENRFILDVMNLLPVENVIAIRTGSIVRTVLGTLGAVWRMRRTRLDAAIDFEFFARSSAVLTYLSGAHVRVGLHGFGDSAPYRGDLMTHRLQYDRRLHTADAFLRMVQAIDLPAGDQRTGAKVPAYDCPEASMLQPSVEELAGMRARIADLAGQAPRRLALLNANASDLLPLRRWPSGRYVELARRLLQACPDLHVAFTGAPSERAAVDELVAKVGSPRCFSMAGKTTMRELLVLYCVADLLVTNDSGPAHFATLTPIEVIVLFGPETPALFGARTRRTHVLWKGLACSPCVSATNNRLSRCGNNLCMQSISVDEVEGLARRLLANPAAARAA